MRSPKTGHRAASRGTGFRVPQIRWWVIVVIGLLVAGFGNRPASADSTGSSGFAIAVAINPAGAVRPGETLQYRFELKNGASVTESAFTATDTVPSGSVLVPHSQSCGTAGGTCSESSMGSFLEWEIPAGTGPYGSFVFAFTVTVTTDNPPSDIQTRLTFRGPGCPPDANCTFDAPTVPVSSMTEPYVSAWGAGLPGIEDESPGRTTTTRPGSDSQNLAVQVPKCSKGKAKVTCPPGRSGNQQAAGKAHKSTGNRFGLAYTGDDQLRSLKAGVLLVLSGTFLFVVSGPVGRRSGRQEFTK